MLGLHMVTVPLEWPVRVCLRFWGLCRFLWQFNAWVIKLEACYDISADKLRIKCIMLHFFYERRINRIVCLSAFNEIYKICMKKTNRDERLRSRDCASWNEVVLTAFLVRPQVCQWKHRDIWENQWHLWIRVASGTVSSPDVLGWCGSLIGVVRYLDRRRYTRTETRNLKFTAEITHLTNKNPANCINFAVMLDLD